MKTNNIEICIIDSNVYSDTENTFLSLKKQSCLSITLFSTLIKDNKLFKAYFKSSKTIIFINGGTILQDGAINTLISLSNRVEKNWIYSSKTKYERTINDICYGRQLMYDDFVLMVKGTIFKKINFEVNRNNVNSVIVDILIRLEKLEGGLETDTCLVSSDKSYRISPSYVQYLSAIHSDNSANVLMHKQVGTYINCLANTDNCFVTNSITVILPNNADIDVGWLNEYYNCTFIKTDYPFARSRIVNKIINTKNRFVCYIGKNLDSIDVDKLNKMLFYASRENAGFIFSYESSDNKKIWFSSADTFKCIKNIKQTNDMISSYAFDDILFYLELIGKENVSIDSNDIVRRINLYEDRPKKHILAFFHELSLTGAPIVFVPAIKYLCSIGYDVFAISLKDGPVKKQIVSSGISTAIIDETTSKLNWHVVKKYYDFVFANTIVLYEHINNMSKSNIPALWWIHDAEEGYKNHLKDDLPITYPKNIKIYAVSEYAKMVLNRYRPKYNVQILQYGLEDKSNVITNVNPFDNYINKHIFVCSGSIEKRKGQNILAESIYLLNKKDLESSVFIFIGKVISKEIYKVLSELKNKYPDNIEISRPISHNEALAYYKYADAVICPSIDDPFPTVMAETMMLSSICICSDNTGFASMIENGENGYVYKNNNPKQLANRISKVINEDDVYTIKKASRRTYESSLTIDASKKTIDKIIKNIK